MSKVKQYYADEAEKKVDKILKDYKENKIDEKVAKEKLLKVDNVNLVFSFADENIDELLHYSKQ